MTRTTCAALLLASPSLVALACGSAAPPKVEPDGVVSATPSLAVTTGTAGAASTSPATEASPSAAMPQTKPVAAVESPGSVASLPVPAAEGPKFFPIDVITGREMAYLIDWANSGAIELAKSSCSGKTEEDSNKHAECLAKARDKFGADVLQFKKDDKGRVKLYVYRRNGSALAETYVANIDLKEISANTVKVSIKGGGSGQRGIMRSLGSFDVKVPNGYSIELEDPHYGRLAYDAKVGLVAH